MHTQVTNTHRHARTQNEQALEDGQILADMPENGENFITYIPCTANYIYIFFKNPNSHGFFHHQNNNFSLQMSAIFQLLRKYLLDEKPLYYILI